MAPILPCTEQCVALNVPVVIKISRAGEHHRISVEHALDFEIFDGLIKEQWEYEGAQFARYLDEDGDECMITAATFFDFLQTAVQLNDGRRVLKVKLLTCSTTWSESTNQMPPSFPAPARSVDDTCRPQNIADQNSEDLSCASSQDGCWEHVEEHEENPEDVFSEVSEDAPSENGSWQHVERESTSTISSLEEECEIPTKQSDPEPTKGISASVGDVEMSGKIEDSDHTTTNQQVIKPQAEVDEKKSSKQQEGTTVHHMFAYHAADSSETGRLAKPLVPAPRVPSDIPQAPSRQQFSRTARSSLNRKRTRAQMKFSIFADEQTNIHMDHICDGCEMTPIQGPRFTCIDCPDYDLCSKCHIRKGQVHNPAHRFKRVSSGDGIAPACLGGCGYGVTFHSTHCCFRCSEVPGQHGPLCSETLFEASSV